ncbi:MAG: glutathione S-transferase C-terminal domain-containing protein [Halioglobus sp.]|nr:glutathione S-transferase C-terminal domain-containing protein [Halioglobus sp.]
MSSFILWGLTASPYQLKMQSLLDFAGHSWTRWPDAAGRWSALSMAARLHWAIRRGAVRRFPAMAVGLDEYPAVPFYTEDGRHFYYDSTALAHHLDQHPERHPAPLTPSDPALAFVCQLIDEAFDEFGLYMVHHMRWVGSARSTPMGVMTAREFKSLLPPGFTARLAARLCRRQAARCPYLFSVAPGNYVAGVNPDRAAPPRPGFPPTHALLEEAWRGYLAGMEAVLAEQPYLLGGRFTLADASAYGQLGMNLVDPEAIELLEALAPRTYRWLCAIRDQRHCGRAGSLALTPSLQPLLRMICATFVPLMVQNAAAYARELAAGETLFNEAAFDRGRALYDGRLLGHPFRAVVKTFQVRVWRDLKASWSALDGDTRMALEHDYLPGIATALGDGASSPAAVAV